MIKTHLSGHKDLNVWKRSMHLVMNVYSKTKTFPKDELYGLSSQMRRAAVSIPSNIAEGAGRKSKKEFYHFLYVALGSLAELETQLLIAKNLGYIPDFDSGIIIEIRKMLNGLLYKLSNEHE